MWDNKIGAAGAGLLAEGIKHAKAPLSLSLNANNIGDDGAKPLAEAIKEVQIPLTLKLCSNGIGAAGAVLLADALKVVRVPITLKLSRNQIGDAGIEALADAIRIAQAPLILSVESNNIGDAKMASLVSAILMVRFPLALNLSNNNISSNGAGLLANAVKQARIPLTLNLSRNKIGGAGGILLVNAINQAIAPLALDFDKNNMGDLAETSLAKARNDNFVIDAIINPSKFASSIGFNMYRKMLEQALSCPAEIAILIQSYISIDDLTWIEVRAIRDADGASWMNKYSSINYEYIHKPLAIKATPMPNADPTLILLNLLHLISSIGSVNSRLPIPQGYVDVPGDGLCFYHAIARQLDGGQGYAALQLQQMAINEIVDHLDRYEGFAAQYGGGLNGFLNYHLQRQDSEKGGWADNIMIQALANALERIIEVQLFDQEGSAIGQVLPIIPHNDPHAPILRIGNIDNLHFVAAANGPVPGGSSLGQLDDEGKMGEEEYDGGSGAATYAYDNSFAPTTAPTVISASSTTPNTTSQVYYETLEFGDASLFEFGAGLMLSGIDRVSSNSD